MPSSPSDAPGPSPEPSSSNGSSSNGSSSSGSPSSGSPDPAGAPSAGEAPDGLPAELPERHLDAYQRIRHRVRSWARSGGRNHRLAEYILLAPDLLHVLLKLSVDADVPARKKGKLGAALVYFLSPVDLIPEAVVGPYGFLDDVVVAAWVLNDLINDTAEDVVRRHWAGDDDVLAVIRRVLAMADEMLQSRFFSAIKQELRRGRASASSDDA
jgi:uncharacterized membrane protein YkvA (DUF1232 family)